MTKEMTMKYLLPAAAVWAACADQSHGEVAMTGDARMGVVHDGATVQFSQRVRLRFTMSGETDDGLEFGATFRAHDAEGAAQGGAFGASDDDKAGHVWISGAFGELKMGDVDSAAEEAFGNLSRIGFTGLDDPHDIPYINGDGADTLDQGPGAAYGYATDRFEIHLGITDGSGPRDATEEVDGEDRPFRRDMTYSVAAALSGNEYKVGIAYLDNGSAGGNNNAYGGSQWIAYGASEIGDWSIKGYVSGFQDGAMGLERSHGISVDYSMDEIELTAFARRDELHAPDDDGDGHHEFLGLGASYDIGGGALLRGGVMFNNIASRKETVADLGIELDF